MACIIVPTIEAVIVKGLEKAAEKKEKAEACENVEKIYESGVNKEVQVEGCGRHASKMPLSRKLRWLNRMLLGGALILAFEHVWHGEIVPYFPFLTAMENPTDAAEMFHEMATVGVSMAVLITVVWAGICLFADSKIRAASSEEGKAEAHR